MKKIFIFVMLVLETNFTYSQSDSLINGGYGKALSPLNDSMPKRKITIGILLHTMEGNLPGGLPNLLNNALCNYVVYSSGWIRPIIDEDRVSNNAGHSTWNGLDSMSLYVVAIEFEGYYNIPPTRGQLSPEVKALIKGIQKRNDIPDSCVFIHPMVACFYPWDPGNPHPGFYCRGRKHDAYFFAKKWVRDSLGLTEMATVDPDVYSGRVIQNKSQALRFYHHYVTEEEIVAYQERIRQERICDTIFCPIIPIVTVSISPVGSEPKFILVPDIYNYIPEIDRRKKKKIKADD